MAASVAENPVFKASELTRKIRNPKPKMMDERNSQECLHQHEATAEGFEDRAKDLKKINPDLCLLPDQNGRTALHVAVCNGQVGVIKELINAKAESSWVLTDEGQPILHLGVANNQLEAIKLLVELVDDEEFLKTTDKDGNTALHLAVVERHIEIIRFLVNCPDLDVNATNGKGDTALDVLMQNASTSCDDEIMEILQGAGSKIRDLPGSEHLQISANHEPATSEQSPPRQQSKMTISGDWEEKRVKLMMVVAILTATLTFEAARNPPNANRTFHTERHHDRTVPRCFCTSGSFFMAIDAIGFLSSLCIIIIIIREPGMRMLMGMMMIAIFSMIVVFTCYSASHLFAQVAVGLWFGCVPLFLLSYLVLPFGKWLLNKYCIIDERQVEEEEGMA